MKKRLSYLIIMALIVLLSTALTACVVPVMEAPSESPDYTYEEPYAPENLPQTVLTEAGYTMADVEELVHVMINNERQSYGLDALEKGSLLEDLAREHSTTMANYGFFSHDRIDGERSWQFWQIPRTTRGENIARTPIRMVIPGPYLTLELVCEWTVSGWMASQGHRENILKPEFTTSGIGVSQAGEDLYITQIFEGAY